MEIKVERLRTDISIAEDKEDKINAEIDRNIDRINFEKRKIAQDELDDLNHMIDKLKNLIPTTEKEIDRHYYFCYGKGSVKVEETGGVLVYIIRGERFGEYIHNAYGKNVKVPEVRGDLRFYRTDLYGFPWANKYGHNAFKNDFSCIAPYAVAKGYGVVDKIDAEAIYVNAHNGKKVKLTLGACSRIEAVTKVPEAGQNIYFSGVPSSADGYNLYAATCY